jgi:hypothetical protein
MLSGDVNANRALLSVLDRADWADDVPRLVTGSLGRQQRGHWDTTTANAWGTLALQRFSARFESTPVAGTTRASLGDETFEAAWQDALDRRDTADRMFLTVHAKTEVIL